MKIRTQLVLASFLLSVLPLTGIVVYSYSSSRRALESAYQHEASPGHQLGYAAAVDELRTAAKGAADVTFVVIRVNA